MELVSVRMFCVQDVAIALNYYFSFLSDKSSLLMDCGEGTYRQMCYHYGQDINIILKQLRTIFVSHMHIDHHLVSMFP